MTTGQRIKAARKRAGLTQKELGERLGITYQTVAQWENDLRNPKYDTLERLADALDVPLEVLLGIGDSVRTELVPEEKEAKDYVKARFAEAETWKARKDEIGEDLAKLNDEGQIEAVKRVKELTEIEKYKYKRKPSPLSTGIKVYGDGPAGSFPPHPQDSPQSALPNSGDSDAAHPRTRQRGRRRAKNEPI